MKAETSTIDIKSRFFFSINLVVALVLLSANIGSQISTYVLGYDYLKGLVPLFYFDEEANIPTFFSMLLLIQASLLLALITVLSATRSASYVSKWAILSLGFLYMSYDEAFSVHERLVEPMRKIMGLEEFGILYFSWVVPAILVVLFLVFFFWRFLLHLDGGMRRKFLIAGALYLGGAIGVELISGYYAESYGMRSVAYSVLITVEEGLEMAGAIMFIWALLGYLSENFKDVRFTFD